MIDTQIIVHHSELWKTTRTLIVGSTSIWVIDPNYFPSEVDSFRKMANELIGHKKAVLLFTHADHDHIVGFPEFSDYHVVASTRFLERDLVASIQQVDECDQRYYIQRSQKRVIPRVDEAIFAEDIEERIIAGEKVVFASAGGHTPDGLFTVFPDQNLLVAGDHLSDVEFPFIEHSAFVYLKTLDTARKLIDEYNIKTLIPGHGNVADSTSDIHYRIEEDIRYVERCIAQAESLLCEGREADTLTVEECGLYKDSPIQGMFVDYHKRNVDWIMKKEITNENKGEA